MKSKDKRTYAFELIAILITIGLVSFSPTQEKKIKKAYWMAGTWKAATKNGTIYESWEIVEPKGLSGKSYSINDKDTVIFETIKLVEEENTLFFIPTVMDQNEQKPVRFKLKSFKGRELTFENKKHDYPQIITYRMIDSDSLVAEISGLQGGKMRGSRFAFSRAK